MQVAVTFRHMDSSEPVRSYVEEKMARVKKYIDEPVEAQVVLSVEKKIRHKVEVTLAAKGITIKARALFSQISRKALRQEILMIMVTSP